jgi:hypothetical protein
VSDDVGASSITDVEGRTGLGRGGSPLEVVTELVLRFDDMHHSLKEWPSAGFAGKLIAETGLGVCPEGELRVGRDGVCAQGLVCASVVLHVPLGAVRWCASTVAHA